MGPVGRLIHLKSYSVHTGPTVKSLGTLSIDRIKIRGSRAQLFLTALLSGEQGRGREGASKGGGVVSRTLPYLVIRIVAFIANIITERERDLKENKKE